MKDFNVSQILEHDNNMGAFSLAYFSEIINKKSATFTATLFTLLFRRLVISLIGCSPAEPIYVSNQSSNIKKQSDTVCFTLPNNPSFRHCEGFSPEAISPPTIFNLFHNSNIEHADDTDSIRLIVLI